MTAAVIEDSIGLDASLAMPRQRPVLPLTVVVLAALLTTTLYLNTHPADVGSIVSWASTNVTNLSGHPLAALLTSAFVTPGNPWFEFVLVAIGCAVVERALGTRRALLIAAGGQVVATLVTEYGAAIASSLRWSAFSSPDRTDVGVSYVMFALLGAATMLLTRRLRVPALVVLLSAVVVPLLVDPEMTTTGHVLSVACGVLGATIRFRLPGLASSAFRRPRSLRATSGTGLR